MRDTASAQVVAYLPRAVALVAQKVVRAGARSPRALAGDLDLCEDLFELGAVVDVAAREKEPERAAPAVAGKVDLGGQSAAGSSEGVMVCRRCGLCPFLRAPAAC
ncbi:hypothetical protein GCM10018987_28590 [Streptomyces cremeus]